MEQGLRDVFLQHMQQTELETVSFVLLLVFLSSSFRSGSARCIARALRRLYSLAFWFEAKCSLSSKSTGYGYVLRYGKCFAAWGRLLLDLRSSFRATAMKGMHSRACCESTYRQSCAHQFFHGAWICSSSVVVSTTGCSDSWFAHAP